jgi:hypothetical protein
MTSKYDALNKYLHLVSPAARDVTLTFKQIEGLVGSVLPKSATDYRAWWGNQVDTTSRPQAAAWIGAGFLVDSVQPKKPGGWVRFKRR